VACPERPGRATTAVKPQRKAPRATDILPAVIIGLAKEGERDAGRLCGLALKRI
jgi:hypothetical protein